MKVSRSRSQWIATSAIVLLASACNSVLGFQEGKPFPQLKDGGDDDDGSLDAGAADGSQDAGADATGGRLTDVGRDGEGGIDTPMATSARRSTRMREAKAQRQTPARMAPTDAHRILVRTEVAALSGLAATPAIALARGTRVTSANFRAFRRCHSC